MTRPDILRQIALEDARLAQLRAAERERIAGMVERSRNLPELMKPALDALKSRCAAQPAAARWCPRKSRPHCLAQHHHEGASRLQS